MFSCTLDDTETMIYYSWWPCWDLVVHMGFLCGLIWLWVPIINLAPFSFGIQVGIFCQQSLLGLKKVRQELLNKSSCAWADVEVSLQTYLSPDIMQDISHEMYSSELKWLIKGTALIWASCQKCWYPKGQRDEQTWHKGLGPLTEVTRCGWCEKTVVVVVATGTTSGISLAWDHMMEHMELGLLWFVQKYQMGYKDEDRCGSL